MKVRFNLAIAFAACCFISLYLGLGQLQFTYDKLLHGVSFFCLAATFYWTFDLPRKRAIALTAVSILGVAAIGSEFLQNALTDRTFDIQDIYANAAGSGLAIFLCGIFHQRLLLRRRQARYDRLRESLADDVEAQLGSQTIELEEASAKV